MGLVLGGGRTRWGVCVEGVVLGMDLRELRSFAVGALVDAK